MRKPLPELISGPRVRLQKHRVTLAQEMFEGIHQDRVRLEEFLPWPKFINSAADEAAYIESTHEKWAQGTLFDYGIIRQADNQFMGTVGVHHIDWGAAQCEVGYWILGECEGEGYVDESVELLEEAVFGAGFREIQIWCEIENERSAQLPRRRGYTLAKTIRALRVVDGVEGDTLVFVLEAGDRATTSVRDR